ncbi:hypothetical protein V1478_018781 [Vespula squamosa]|uniref:Uncharacterized protein n=1 Tax=Vespula squamosa TaxID=30214 RepID=A0ABD1ZW48_VESSQ
MTGRNSRTAIEASFCLKAALHARTEMFRPLPHGNSTLTKVVILSSSLRYDPTTTTTTETETETETETTTTETTTKKKEKRKKPAENIFYSTILITIIIKKEEEEKDEEKSKVSFDLTKDP